MVFKFRNEETRKIVSDTAKRTVKDRQKRQREAISFLIKCNELCKSKSCVVCGESMQYCLDIHHLEGKKKNKKFCVNLCASCHRIFDKGGGLRELKFRRKKYYKYNMMRNKNLKMVEAGKKAAITKKRKVAARKAWKTRNLRSGARKAWVTRRNQQIF